MKIRCSSLLSLSRFLHRQLYVTKRLVATNMSSSVNQTQTSDEDKKSNNLLAKRFIGAEKNIW